MNLPRKQDELLLGQKGQRTNGEKRMDSGALLRTPFMYGTSRKMKMKTHAIMMLLCATLLSAQSGFGKTPEQIAENVLSLTEAAAVLNVCFESSEYKKLSTEKALELHRLDMHLADLVQKVADYYDDDALYMTYEMMRVKMSSDPVVKEYGRKKYQYCGSNLFREMEAYVAESEQLIKSFLPKAQSKDSEAAWPNAAKRSYIDRCTSSLKSQGLSPNYGHPYCSCITDGMEKEFGMQEYDQMMKAQPNPSGSSYDKRLYKVFTSCSHILPQ